MKTRNTSNAYYGWIICLSCCLLLFCVAGLGTTGFSAYQPYLIKIGGLTNTQASSLIFFRNLFVLGAMLSLTRLIKLFELRRIVTTGMLLCALAFAAFGMADNYIGYCAAACLMGIAVGIGGLAAISVLISRWFIDHRGLALGICMASTGLSAIIASPFITAMVSKVSLRMSFLTEGAFIALCSVFVWMFVRNTPESIGAVPIGYGHQAEEERKVFAKNMPPRTLAFLMYIGILMYGIPANVLYTCISVLFQSTGYEAVQISNLLTIFGTALLFGKFVYGQVNDKIGTLKASWIFYFLEASGTFLCCLARSGNYSIAVVSMVLVGSGMAIGTMSVPIYASGVATEEEYPSTVTRYQILSTGGALMFSTVPGIMADFFGDYVSAFILMLAIIIIGSLLLQLTYRKIRLIDADNK